MYEHPVSSEVFAKSSLMTPYVVTSDVKEGTSDLFRSEQRSCMSGSVGDGQIDSTGSSLRRNRKLVNDGS